MDSMDSMDSMDRIGFEGSVPLSAQSVTEPTFLETSCFITSLAGSTSAWLAFLSGTYSRKVPLTIS